MLIFNMTITNYKQHTLKIDFLFDVLLKLSILCRYRLDMHLVILITFSISGMHADDGLMMNNLEVIMQQVDTVSAFYFHYSFL